MADDLDYGATVRGHTAGQQVFKRYTLTRILGRGGMGVVWLAHDRELERDVALKFLPEVVAADPQAIHDLKRETRRSLDLTHPHIIRIHDFLQDATAAAISMEYVAGDTLAGLKLQQPGGHFEAPQLQRWVEELAAALDYAHTVPRIVHRDLKPANLMVDARGSLKIADFGIAASVADSVSRVSVQAGSSGTPVYMSPQQMMGEKPAVTDDVYALGATLYELLTGRPPFFSGNIIAQVQGKQPPSMTERRAELEASGEPIPPAWEETIAACLAKDPAARPASAAAVAAGLSGVPADIPVVAPPPAEPTPVSNPTAPPVPRPKPPPGPVAAPSPAAPASRTPARRWFGLIAVLAVVTMGAVYFVGAVIPEQRLKREQRQIHNNLRQLSAAADLYMLENGASEARVDQLVGPEPSKYIRSIASVAGEDYFRMGVLRLGAPLSVTAADGTRFTYDPNEGYAVTGHEGEDPALTFDDPVAANPDADSLVIGEEPSFFSANALRQDFDQWVAEARISGARFGSSPIVMINGRVSRIGDVLDESRGITLEEIDESSRTVTFRSSAGFEAVVNL